MNGRKKPKAQLIEELEKLRARLAELEREEANPERAEESLRIKDAAIASAINAIAIADLEGNLTYVNDSFLKMMGYDDSGEVLAKPTVRFWETEERAWELVEALRDSGGWIGELVAMRKDGSLFDVELSASMVKDEAGEPICMLASFVDITKRKRAEQTLRGSEQELTARSRIADIFLTIPDEEMYAEVLQVVLETMESKYGVFGYVDQDSALVCPSMTREVWSECQVPDKDIVFPREAWGSIWGRALVEKKTLYSNEPSRVPQGHIPILRSMALPIIHRGEVIGLIHVANKPTDYDERDRRLLEAIVGHIGPVLHARLQRDRQHEERERAEQESRKNLVFLTSIMEGTPAPVFLKDRQGRYEILNIATARGLGRASVQEVLGRDDTELIPRELARKLQENDRKIMESGAPVEYEELVGTEDSQRTYRTMKSPYRDEHGEVMGIIGVARDVTDLKRAEQALRGERDKAQSCLDIAGTMIALVDRSERITLINKKGCEILGYQQEELLGQNWFDLLVPQRIGAEVRGFFQKLMAGQVAPVEYYENPLLTKDGEERLIAFHNTVLTEPSGRITAALFSAEDITERKRAEEALRRVRDELEKRVEERTAELARVNEGLLKEIAERERADEALRELEQRFRQVAENAQELIWEVDADGLYTYASPMVEPILGYRPEQIVGKKHFYDLFHPEEREELKKKAFEAFAKKAPFREFLNRNEHKNGETVWLLTSGVPILDEEGNLLGYIGADADITDRKRAEEALRESEKRFKNIFNNALVGIYRTTPDGRILMANPTLVRMLGYDSFEELAKRNLEEKGFDLRYSRSDFRERIETEGRVVGLESAWRRRDGSILFVTENAEATRDEHGNTLYYEGTVQDITERKRAEEQIKASLKEKELLLKEIQHRVKNNLQVISSLFDLQSRYAHNESMVNLLTESRNRVRSIALIHEKLYDAKDLTRIDFAEYTEALAAHLFRSYGVASTDIKLRTDVDSVSLSVDTAIPCALIVNELVSNSLKHAFPSGKQGEIRIRLSSDNGNFILTVGDNGAGLPEDLDFRDTSSLGLRLVKTLTRQLKGTIELDRNGGTTFKITFPRSQYKGGKKR